LADLSNANGVELVTETSQLYGKLQNKFVIWGPGRTRNAGKRKGREI